MADTILGIGQGMKEIQRTLNDLELSPGEIDSIHRQEVSFIVGQPGLRVMDKNQTKQGEWGGEWFLGVVVSPRR